VRWRHPSVLTDGHTVRAYSLATGLVDGILVSKVRARRVERPGNRPPVTSLLHVNCGAGHLTTVRTWGHITRAPLCPEFAEKGRDFSN
jgi:hypothetical protein